MSQPPDNDRNPITLVGYGLLLLAFTVPAWWALAVVVDLYLGNDEEFGHNILVPLIWGPICLAIALPTSIGFIRLLHRRAASFRTIVFTSALASAATGLYLVKTGVLDFNSPDYAFIVAEQTVSIIATLFLLAALVLALGTIDMRLSSRRHQSARATKH